MDLFDLALYVPHDSVAISFLVAIDDGDNLGNVKIDDVQTLAHRRYSRCAKVRCL